MAASRLTHELLCIGAHASSEHPFPAANASAVHHLLTGGLGPSRLVSECLVGARANRAAITRALDEATARGAKHYVFYFSGRASAQGVHAADGMVTGEALSSRLSRIPARSLLIIFDIVIGTAPDSALAPRWARALVQSRAGTGLAAARATRIGAGAEGAGLSRFTSALLTAVETAAGDMKFEGAKYISDKAALATTHDILGARWGVTHKPIELGTFGDIPLAKSQAQKAIGAARFENISVGAGFSLAVSYTMEERAHLATSLHWSLETLGGAVLGESSSIIVTQRAIETGRSRVRLPSKLLRSLSPTDPRLGAADTVPLRWRLSLRDVHGRVLDERILDHSYPRPTALSRRR